MIQHLLNKGILLIVIVLFPSVSNAYQVSSITLRHITNLKNARWVDVAWSYDGVYLAAVDREETIYIWDSRDWDVVTSFKCGGHHWEMIQSLDWSPINYTLAAGCAEQEEFVQVSNLGKLTIVRFNTDNEAVAWSVDGSMIAVSQGDETVAILNSQFETIMTLGEPVLPPPPDSGQTEAGPSPLINFRWEEDGEHLAVSGIGQLIVTDIWDLEKRQPILAIRFAYDVIWGDSEFEAFISSHSLERGDFVQAWVTYYDQITLMGTGILPARYDYVIKSEHRNHYLVRCQEGLIFYDTLFHEEVILQSTSQEPIPCSQYDMAWSGHGLLAIAEDDGTLSIWEVVREE